MSDRPGPVIGAVLTGGRSSRMGRDKALIEIDGQTLVDRMGAVVIEAGCSRVVAVGPAHLGGTLDHLDDLYPGEGPLGGLLTALTAADPDSPFVAVVACDLATLDAQSLATLIAAIRDAESEIDVAMARTDRLEPLCAVWSTTSRTILQAAFDGGERAIRRALAPLRLLAVDLPARALGNVNTPDDLPSR